MLSRGDALKHWLEPLFEEHGEHTELLPPIVVSALALTMVAIGIALAVVKYQLSEVDAVAPENVTEFTQIARRDLLQDEINEALFMRPGQVITSALVKFDKSVIDGAVRGIGQIAMSSGSSLRRTQTGFVRSYAMLILIGAAALIAAIWVVTL